MTGILREERPGRQAGPRTIARKSAPTRTSTNSAIVANVALARLRAAGLRFVRPTRALLAAASLLTLVACYPRYDWREYRPDCSKGWCGFVASFPGKVTSATRDIPVGSMQLPLTVHVVSVGDVRFAITVFELLPGSDADAARRMLESKLVDDVGGTDVRRGRVVMHAADKSEIAADSYAVEGSRSGATLQATARFVDRRGRLVEMLVIGPAAELATDSGREEVETFFSSLRLD